MGDWLRGSSEAGVEADGDLPGLRVRAEVEPLREVRPGVLADLRVEARVVGDREEVLSADVELEVLHGPERAARDQMRGHGPAEPQVLSPDVGAVLDEQRRRVALEGVPHLRRGDAVLAGV